MQGGCRYQETPEAPPPLEVPPPHPVGPPTPRSGGGSSTCLRSCLYSLRSLRRKGYVTAGFTGEGGAVGCGPGRPCPRARHALPAAAARIGAVLPLALRLLLCDACALRAAAPARLRDREHGVGTTGGAGADVEVSAAQLTLPSLAGGARLLPHQLCRVRRQGVHLPPPARLGHTHPPLRALAGRHPVQMPAAASAPPPAPVRAPEGDPSCRRHHQPCPTRAALALACVLLLLTP